MKKNPDTSILDAAAPLIERIVEREYFQRGQPRVERHYSREQFTGLVVEALAIGVGLAQGKARGDDLGVVGERLMGILAKHRDGIAELTVGGKS